MKKFLYTTALVCAVGLSASAHAQTIDYTTYEEMFGEPVTTSANGTPQRVSEVPLNMEIITEEEIARMPATNLVDVLRGHTSIGIFDNTNYSKDVGMRGTNSPLSEKILVLVNGRQVYIDHYGMVIWELVPVQLSEIKQIEVVKGPNTALFGFNAVSGVINIITKNPLYDDLGAVDVALGNRGLTKGSYSQIHKLNDKFAVRFSAGGQDVDNTDLSGELGSEQSVFSEEVGDRQFLAEALYQVGDKTQMAFEVSRADADHDVVVISSRSGSDGRLNSFKGTLTSDTDYGLVEFKAYVNDANIQMMTPPTASLPATFNSKSKTRVKVFSASDLFKVGTDHKFRINTEYRHNELKFELPNGAGDNGNATLYEIYSAGGLWDWTISDKWNLSTGVRLDHLELAKGPFLQIGHPYTQDDYNQDITEFAYNAGLVYRPDTVNTFRLMHSRGIDIPSLIEFGYQARLLGGAVALYGNPELEASHVLSYELGYDRKVDAIDGQFRTAAFYQNHQELQNAFAFVSSTTPPLYLSGRNIGDLDIYGLEAELEGKMDMGLRWGVNYTLQLPREDYNSARGTAFPFEDYNPKHMFNIHLGYDYQKWQFDAYAQHVSAYNSDRAMTGQIADTVKEIDAYTLLNAKIGYKYSDNVTVSLNGIGVNGDTYESTGVAKIDRRLWGQVAVKF